MTEGQRVRSLASKARRLGCRASPPPRGRSEDAAPTLPMYATPEKRRLLMQLGCRAAATRTHERRRKRYFTAVLLTAAEVLRDIRRRTEAAELNWVKDIPAAFDDSGVARSCLNPQLFHVDDYAKYTIIFDTSMTLLLIWFQIIPSFSSIFTFIFFVKYIIPTYKSSEVMPLLYCKPLTAWIHGIAGMSYIHKSMRNQKIRIIELMQLL